MAPEKNILSKDLDSIVSELKKIRRGFGEDTLRGYFVMMQRAYRAEIESLTEEEREKAEHKLALVKEAFGDNIVTQRIKCGPPLTGIAKDYFGWNSLPEQDKRQFKTLLGVMAALGAAAGITVIHESCSIGELYQRSMDYLLH